MEWDKREVIGKDGREYFMVAINEEQLRIPKETMSVSNPGPSVQAMFAWTWPGLRSKAAFRELEASGQDFSVITVRFHALKVPGTPYRDTVHYLNNQRDDGAVTDVAKWGPNPHLRRHQVRGHMAYYEPMDQELRLPSGNPVIASCSWLREEGDGSCEVTMRWSDELGIQYAFADHDLLKKLVPVHRAVTDFIEAVHRDKE